MKMNSVSGKANENLESSFEKDLKTTIKHRVILCKDKTSYQSTEKFLTQVLQTSNLVIIVAQIENKTKKPFIHT